MLYFRSASFVEAAVKKIVLASRQNQQASGLCAPDFRPRIVREDARLAPISNLTNAARNATA
ncbi:MAG: hypothetical protein ABI233_06905, partial [Chthoniobacterales bacterium]